MKRDALVADNRDAILEIAKNMVLNLFVYLVHMHEVQTTTTVIWICLSHLPPTEHYLTSFRTSKKIPKRIPHENPPCRFQTRNVYL